MQNKKLKAVIYARVSSIGQEKEGFSIPAQLDLLRDYAKEKDFDVVEEFVEAESAKQAGRQKFNEMLKFLKKNKNVKTILVEKTDRLYRNFQDFVNIEALGFNIYFVKEGILMTKNSSSNDKLYHGFNVLIAKRFIDNLREETQKGRQKKIEEGYFIGQVPYGYKKLDKNTTVFHEQKSKFVKRAFELYAQGDISLEKLRSRLYNEGFIYTPSSDKITTGQLEKMLKNECYTGMLRYAGKVYPGKHPAIVDKKLFLKVQAAFKKDNKPKTQQNHLFRYSGFIKCAVCGRGVTCEIKHNKFVYYHCTGNYGKCPNKKIYIREEKFDEQIEEAIKNVVIDDSIADYLNTILEESYKELNLMTKEKHNYFKTEIKQIQTRQDKLLDMFLEGNFDKDIWNEKNSQYEKQKERLQNQINAYKTSDGKFLNEGKKIIELAKHTYNLYSKQNIEEQRKLLKNIFSNCTLNGEKLSYEYNTPYAFFAKIAKNKKKYACRDSNAGPSA